MYPHSHLIIGFIFGVLGWKIGVIQTNDIFIIALLSVLIDLDHYLDYIVRNKDYHPKRFLNSVLSKKDNHNTIFHNITGITIIVPFIFIIGWFDLRLGYIALVSYLPHMILDHIDLVNKRLVNYDIVEIFGLKLPWNFAQESIFLIMALFAMVVLFYK
jgi:hypothetical protein